MSQESTDASATSSSSTVNDDKSLLEAIKLLSKARRVVVFTGAGMSADSGVATFRTTSDGGQPGVWEGIKGKIGLATFGTPIGWSMFPETGWKMYLREFYGPIAKAQPNPGHHAIAELESFLSSDGLAVITMNVDGFHQRAGNTKVYEVHGTLSRNRCVKNGHPMEIDQEYLSEGYKSKPVPKCTICGSTPRPDCVLFTEGLPEDVWTNAYLATRSLGEGDVMLVIGTSSVVYPAAGLPELAHDRGASIIEFNLNSTMSYSRLLVQGKCGETLPKLVDGLKKTLQS